MISGGSFTSRGGLPDNAYQSVAPNEYTSERIPTARPSICSGLAKANVPRNCEAGCLLPQLDETKINYLYPDLSMGGSIFA